MRIQSRIILSLAIALTITSAASAQEEVGVAITLQVAGQPYHFEGKAACSHVPVASIHNEVAERWEVQQIDNRRAVMLTLWHPRSKSSDIFTLSVQIGSEGYLLSTTKSGKGGSVRGSGKVGFTRSGAGGTFTINATTVDGDAITGTMKCSAFTAPMAEGG